MSFWHLSLIFLLNCLFDFSQALPRPEPSFLPERLLEQRITFGCDHTEYCTPVSVIDVAYTIVLEYYATLSTSVRLPDDKEVIVSYNTGSSSSHTTVSLELYCQSDIKGLEIPVPNSGDWTQTVSYSKDCNGNLRLIIGSTSSTDNVVVTYKISSVDRPKDSSLVYKILGPIAGCCGLAIIILLIRRWRKNVQRNREAIRPVQVILARRDEPERMALNERNFEKRFPEKQYKEFKSSFPQTTCSICLDELKNTSCRQLYCEHIFHSECVKVWFTKLIKNGNAFCPNCNKNMMKKEKQVRPRQLGV